ncbi:MacS family sensor histidine kinase [Streptomyces ovatisporus]|uniref:Oxygen sensor histidine kinase NreB n=1 Tax=Streptomyces ovatisporus TaxID=1128682 RepID=A0ABV9AFQ1_9ACTN
MSVEQPLWHALTGYRLLAVGYAITVYVWALDHFRHPVPGAVYLGVLTVWTLATLSRVSSARRCTKSFLAVDIALGVVGILLSVYVDAAGAVNPTIPTIWVAGPVLAFSLKGGWRWGGAASVLVGIANILEQGEVTRPTLHNVLLVCVASVGIGYVVEVVRASERTLAQALQIEAATRERERLARDIHDSVLQVLAMVQRRGTALGGEAAELGRMAGEQEVALRTLVSSGLVPAQGSPPGREQDEPLAAGAARGGSGGGGRRIRPSVKRRPGRGGGTGGSGTGGTGAGGVTGGPECDLRPLLSRHAGAGVTFVEPGAPVPLPEPAARELAAAVSAALDNVRHHAKAPAGGPAHAWISLEDEPDAVLVTVRDDGPGLPEGRLADAEAEGRLGVALSIRGRMRELGGSAELVSVPGQGTEVELRLPKRAAGGSAES